MTAAIEIKYARAFVVDCLDCDCDVGDVISETSKHITLRQNSDQLAELKSRAEHYAFGGLDAAPLWMARSARLVLERIALAPPMPAPAPPAAQITPGNWGFDEMSGLIFHGNEQPIAQMLNGNDADALAMIAGPKLLAALATIVAAMPKDGGMVRLDGDELAAARAAIALATGGAA